MRRTTLLLSLLALTACGEPTICEQAEAHLGQCLSQTVNLVEEGASPEQCARVLATPCPAREAMSGRGNILCKWFGLFCPKSEEPEPQAPATPAPPAPKVCSAPELPASLELKETGWSMMAGSGYTSFEIRSGSQKLGKVEQKVLSWTRSFNYYDAQGSLLATARQAAFSWGVQVDIFDCNQKKIGTLKENLLKSWLKVETTYDILDAAGVKVATSEKQDWITTDFYLRDTGGRLVAELHRPWNTLFGESWKVTIHYSQALDPRLYIMVGAYKTSVDKERREQQAKEQEDD
jgi:uncharacterized protein YxjI